MDPDNHTIVIGASAGGVEALLRLIPALPGSLAAPILVVLHIGPHRSQLPDLLNARSGRRAVFASTGATPRPGMVYVAPPDQHMLLEGGRLRLFRGPKEHHARPAINPLFRSAALDRGSRTIGVVLTGLLDDGAAGLHAIKSCGGVAVVQDPDDAAEPSMPRSAIAGTAVDRVATLDAMAGVLDSLARPGGPPAAPVDAPEWLKIEHAISLGINDMQDVGKIGAPSTFTCPDCGGALFELREGRPVRFLCHTGHAFSLRSLAATQEQATDVALWSGLRALQESESILRRLAKEQSLEAPGSESATLREAERLATFINQMHFVVTSAPPSGLEETTAEEPEQRPVET